MLKEKYNEDIFILKHRGRETVIYYKTINLTKICSDWLSKKSIDTFEKNAVVTFAAEILRAEILSAKYENSSYPPAQNFSRTSIQTCHNYYKFFLNIFYLKENRKLTKIVK